MGGDFLLTVAVALQPVVLFLFGLAVRIIMRQYNLDQDTALRENFERALQGAAGLAYVTMLRGGKSAPQALDDAASYLVKQMPDTIGQLGVQDSASLKSLIEGRLGRLLAQDPTVSLPQSAMEVAAKLGSGKG